jgi:hypothetical protein
VDDDRFPTVPKYGPLKSNITVPTLPLLLPTVSFLPSQLFTPTRSPLLAPLILPLTPQLPLVVDDQFPIVPKFGPLKLSTTALTPPLLLPMELFLLFQLFTPTKLLLLVPLTLPLTPLPPLAVNDPSQMPPMWPLPNSNISALTPPLLPLMESFPAFAIWNPLPFGDPHSPSRTLPKSLLPVLLTWPLLLPPAVNDPFKTLPK